MTERAIDIPDRQGMSQVLKTNFYQAIPWHSVKSLYVGVCSEFDRILRTYSRMCHPIFVKEGALVGSRAREFYRQLNSIKQVLQCERKINSLLSKKDKNTKKTVLDACF